MLDGSSSEEGELELDDLRGLQLELDALRAELGDGYAAYENRGEGQEGSDAEDNDLLLLPSPGAALAATMAVPLPPPRPHAPPPGPAISEGDEGIEDSEATGEEDEEERQQREEAEERQQAAQMVTAALHPNSMAKPRHRACNQQLLAPALSSAQPPEKQQQQKKKQAEQGGPNAAKSKQAVAGTSTEGGKQQGKAAWKKRKKRKGNTAADADGEEATAAAAAPPTPVSKLQAIREALEANRQLQDRLRRLLTSTDRAIDRNAKVMLQVRALKAKKTAAPAVATVAASAEPAQLQAPIGTSWFWGSSWTTGGGDEAVPPNPDAQALLPLYKHLPFSFRGSRWSEEEQQRLRDGVLQLVQELQLQDVMLELQQRLESGGAVSMVDYEASRQRIAALSLDSPIVEQLSNGFQQEEWATLVQRSRLQRSTTECQLHWRNSLAPSLSKRKWAAKEDTHLKRLVEKHHAREWQEVSRELAVVTGTGTRPALACLQRYQQLAVAAAKEARQFGTEEGVARLSELVALHGSSWKHIAEEFGGGWEPEQLMHIWRRHAQRGHAARRGKWSREEDDLLLRAMAVHGRKWSLVARLVPGRTDVQCRERYMNVLNPDVATFKPWSEEDDRHLVDLVARHTQPDGKIKWSAVAAGLPGRTDKQCAIRHRALALGESGTIERKSRKKVHEEAGGNGAGSSRSKTKRRTPAPSTSKGGEGVEGGSKSKKRRQTPPAPVPAEVTERAEVEDGDQCESGAKW